MHYFSDDFTPIFMLPPTNKEIFPVVPMEEDTDDQTPNEVVAQSFESNVEIMGVPVIISLML